jgi:hypothetical protein
MTKQNNRAQIYRKLDTIKNKRIIEYKISLALKKSNLKKINKIF